MVFAALGAVVLLLMQNQIRFSNMMSLVIRLPMAADELVSMPGCSRSNTERWLTSCQYLNHLPQMKPKKPARLLGNDTSVPVFAEGGFALAVVSPDLLYMWTHTDLGHVRSRLSSVTSAT